MKYLAITILAMIFAVGCGGERTPVKKISDFSENSIGSKNAVSTDNSITCAESDNILPGDSLGNVLGAGTYTACKSKSSTTTLLIEGTPSSSAICIYPTHINSDGKISAYMNGDEIYKVCFDWSYEKSPYDVTITPPTDSSGAEYNHLKIVAKEDAYQFQTCLVDYSEECPPYSEGNI